DPGTLWHTVVGEQILQTGEIPRRDSFSFTHADDEWLAQQWMGECAMALVHRAAGLDGLLLAACATIAALFAFVVHRAARGGLSGPLTLMLVLFVAAASSYHFMPRPHLATLLFMTVGSALLCDIEAGRISKWWLLLIPPAIALWSNIHGGALGGLASLLIVALGWLLRPKALRRPMEDSAKPMSAILVGATVGLSIAAILINPFGVSLPRVWISLMSSDLLPRVIVEHGPTQIFSPSGMMILVLGIAYLAALARARKWGIRIVWLLPLIWFALALSRVRHGPIFAFVTAIVLVDMLPHLIIKSGQTAVVSSQFATSTSGIFARLKSAVPAVALVAFCLLLKAEAAPVPVFGAKWTQLDSAYWPVSATDALIRHAAREPRPTRVFNDMRYGGYLLYRAAAARIYIDDRCELYRDAGIRRYLELLKDPRLIEGEAACHDIDTALVRSASPMAKYLKNTARWTMLHEDSTASLYVRNPEIARCDPADEAHQTSSISPTP
ncbi:MAG TPA: hypothetical protein VNT79_07310, partial [Phycisphaerae bacterium]|nr:hypothetical protein [Phycisphaerae bacterium]